jgi:hypothetical protein
MPTTHKVKKTALPGSTDIAGLKSSRYERLQVSYGVIPATAYTIGDTLVFSDVPAWDIVKATVIAHSASPAVLDVYPGSDNSGTFTLDLPTGFTSAVKLSYIIEYVRGTGRVGSASGDNFGEGELFKVTIQSGSVNNYSVPVAEEQVAGDSL